MSEIRSKLKEIPPLLNPPLLEAIFELRWELQVDRQSGRMRDPSYPVMYGRIYERLQSSFPFVEDLSSNQVHPEANPYVVRHRLRKQKEGYPLIQIGPGIITVNETMKYSWTSFRDTILNVVEMIEELYPAHISPLNFIKAEIRYLNGIAFEPKNETALVFLRDKLNIGIHLDSDLFEMNEIKNDPEGMSLNLAYPLNKPVGSLLVGTQMGQIQEKPAFLIQSVIQSVGEVVPQDKESFQPWLSSAHCVAENCFLSFFKGPLLEAFCGG